MELNPELVQAEYPGRSRQFTGTKAPVFLIHDGGGTTFAYHCLEPLHRLTYGIFNPNFFTSEPFTGGVPEMGRLYADFIRKATSDETFPAKRSDGGRVDILLGGWSLGGLLSLEVARQLAQDQGIRVLGIVMVDSVYIRRPPTFQVDSVAPANLSEEGKSKNEILCQRAMTETRRMMPTWELPVWDGDEAGNRPKIILLRAKGYAPVEETYKGRISGIDVYREDQRLGWDSYDKDLFLDVKDIDGHHYELFLNARIEGTSEALRSALATLQWAANS